MDMRYRGMGRADLWHQNAESLSGQPQADCLQANEIQKLLDEQAKQLQQQLAGLSPEQLHRLNVEAERLGIYAGAPQPPQQQHHHHYHQQQQPVPQQLPQQEQYHQRHHHHHHHHQQQQYQSQEDRPTQVATLNSQGLRVEHPQSQQAQSARSNSQVEYDFRQELAKSQSTKVQKPQLPPQVPDQAQYQRQSSSALQTELSIQHQAQIGTEASPRQMLPTLPQASISKPYRRSYDKAIQNPPRQPSKLLPISSTPSQAIAAAQAAIAAVKRTATEQIDQSLVTETVPAVTPSSSKHSAHDKTPGTLVAKYTRDSESGTARILKSDLRSDSESIDNTSAGCHPCNKHSALEPQPQGRKLAERHSNCQTARVHDSSRPPAGALAEPVRTSPFPGSSREAAESAIRYRGRGASRTLPAWQTQNTAVASAASGSTAPLDIQDQASAFLGSLLNLQSMDDQSSKSPDYSTSLSQEHNSMAEFLHAHARESMAANKSGKRAKNTLSQGRIEKHRNSRGNGRGRGSGRSKGKGRTATKSKVSKHIKVTKSKKGRKKKP